MLRRTIAAHTVLVAVVDSEVSVEALVTAQVLVEDHSERDAGCRVWVSTGAPQDLGNWARAGYPEPNPIAVPTDGEVFEVARVRATPAG